MSTATGPHQVRLWWSGGSSQVTPGLGLGVSCEWSGGRGDRRSEGRSRPSALSADVEILRAREAKEEEHSARVDWQRSRSGETGEARGGPGEAEGAQSWTEASFVERGPVPEASWSFAEQGHVPGENPGRRLGVSGEWSGSSGARSEGPTAAPRAGQGRSVGAQALAFFGLQSQCPAWVPTALGSPERQSQPLSLKGQKRSQI